ncbi:hypothetical protein HRbin19_00357 [bacterium HR19]|nr:hypothetical protein HRbin19_00357 [bacterium HR19]
MKQIAKTLLSLSILGLFTVIYIVRKILGFVLFPVILPLKIRHNIKKKQYIDKFKVEKVKIFEWRY